MVRRLFTLPAEKRKTYMAIYHCSIKIISRGKGQSAVAAAAYRAGELIRNEYDGITHDYTRKGGVAHTEILLSRHTPAEYENRSVLWNAVEQIEKAKNSQLAREIELALPAKLTLGQNISIVREYVTRHFVSAGMCADICVHDKKDGNPHAHIMLTMRPFEPSGEWGVKQKKEYILDRRGEKIYDPQKKQYKCRSVPSTDWNEQTKAEQWRAGWAEACNAFLERQELPERVDHRSYERQGIDQVPTVHMGVAATQMERKGIATERGDRNREIVVTNKQLRQLRARIKHLTDWLKEAAAPAAPPTLMGVLQSILSGDGQQDHHVRIPEKMAARVLLFLRENDISTLPALRRKVYEMQNQLDDVRGSMKYIERRVNALDEHIRQGGIYLKHRELYGQYQQLKPRKQAAFYEAHRAELMVFEAAKRYLDACLNGHALPLEAWKKERAKLAAERAEFSRDYAALKEQVLDVENVQWAVERIVREAKQPQKDKREKAKVR